MSTPAVTKEASAVSTPDREPTSRFLPTGKNYRLTGELPEKLDVAATQLVDDGEHVPAVIREEREKETQVPPVKEGESATPNASETAAGSEPAKPAQKTAATSENRWAKITRENRELRERLERLEKPPQRETVQESQPATETKPKTNLKPKIDDVDPKTNQPKFKSFAEYEEAKDQWLVEEGERRAVEKFSQTTQASEQDRQRQAIQQGLTEHVTKQREVHPDYDATMEAALGTKEADGRSAIFYQDGSHFDRFFLAQPDRGVSLLYHLAKNIDDPAIREIFARNPQGTDYKLGQIEQISRLAVLANTYLSGEAKPNAKSAVTETTSVKPVTQAPRPPHQTSGKGAVGKDPVAEALETGDSESYIREENRRALERRKKGK
jgi:hypothetical protein